MHSPERGAPLYRLENVERQWGQDSSSFRLRIPDLTICAGEQIAVTGVSGSGKSTLLDMLGLVLNPTSADRFEFQAAGQKPSKIDRMWEDGKQDDLTGLRKHHLGYVLQTGALLGFLNVRENISLSCDVLGQTDPEAIAELAGRLGIRQHLDKMPSALSIGERQRVAIARAVAHKPPVILADEPTASLDPDTATTIMDLFLEIAAEQRTTLIMVSHDWDRVAQLGFRQLVPEVKGAVAVVKG